MYKRQTLWYPHGTDPDDAAYAYLLMPGAAARTVAARAADTGWLTVLANTRDQQAVRIPSLGLTAANFWTPGTTGPLTVTAPASVLVRRQGRTLSLHLAAPLRTGEPVELTWHHPVTRVTAHDDSVEVLATGSTLRLRVLPGAACAAHACRAEPG